MLPSPFPGSAWTRIAAGSEARADGAAARMVSKRIGAAPGVDCFDALERERDPVDRRALAGADELGSSMQRAFGVQRQSLLRG